MTPHYTKVHLKFKINTVSYNQEDLTHLAYAYIKEGEPHEKDLGLFLQDWLDINDYVFVQTSGSTGKPKKIKIYKQAMVNSAIATGDFFKLKPGDSVLHALPAKYIAGKMMLVRAMILGLDLSIIKPALELNIDTRKHYDFSAFIPMQLQYNLDKIENIKSIIVGGGRVSSLLRQLVSKLKTRIYETYGMTETVTHIAVKKINHLEYVDALSLFEVLPYIEISTDARSCLVINAPRLSPQLIITNDIVKLHANKTFSWLGRYDHVINTGGVKVYPEVIEEKLQNKLERRFFIAAITDDVLGQKVVLVIEGKKKLLDASLYDGLQKYEIPKTVFFISVFKETDTGKVNRNKTMELL